MHCLIYGKPIQKVRDLHLIVILHYRILVNIAQLHYILLH
nr:MAG TPA: hypothetical protein [Caudoviricetes sp.]